MHNLSTRVKKTLFLLSRPRYLPFALRGAIPSSELLPLVRSVSGPVRTVFDVGANRGQFTLLARDLFPRATIYSFEPLPNPRIRSLIGSEQGVSWVECALTDRPGHEVLHVAKASDNSSLFAPKFAEIERTLQVRCARLDALTASMSVPGPVLLKIDVQGGELRVLRGCGDLLDSIEWVLVEVSFAPLYEGQPLADEVISYLTDRGFGITSMLHGTLVQGTVGQADILFRRRSAIDDNTSTGSP